MSTDTTAAAVTADACETLLRRIDARHQDRGWIPPGKGGGAVLYVVTDRRQAATTEAFAAYMGDMRGRVHTARLTAWPLLGPAQFEQSRAGTGAEEAETMARIARDAAFFDVQENLRRADAAGGLAGALLRGMVEFITGLRAVLTLPGVAGFATCFEAHQRSEEPEQTLLRHTVGDRRRIEEHPDAQEVRWAMMRDVHGGTHALLRKRPPPGGGHSFAEVWSGAVDGGRISHALRMLCDLVTGDLPVTAAEAQRRYPGSVDAALDAINRRAARPAGQDQRSDG